MTIATLRRPAATARGRLFDDGLSYARPV